MLTLGTLTLDPGSRSVHRGATAIELTAREYGLLHYLMRSHDQVVSKPRYWTTSGTRRLRAGITS